MFIKNLLTGMVHEMTNEDVINQCSKDENYIVASTLEGLEGAVDISSTLTFEEAEPSKPEEPAQEEEKKEPEPPKEEDELPFPDYSTKTVKELREIAKNKGIQGYKNMNKETLIAVIEAH